MDAPPPDSGSSAALSPVPAEPVVSADERQWAMFCHLSALVGHVLMGFGHIVGPLVLWLIKRDTMPFVNSQGKESLNFQISVTIYALISAAMSFFCVGLILLLALVIFDVVVVIMACVATSNGKAYKYPLCIRFIQ